MIFFHQILLVDLIRVEFARLFIPYQPLPAAEADITHLSHDCNVRASLYAAAQILHFPAADHVDEVGHMLVQPIVRRLFKRLAYLIL